MVLKKRLFLRGKHVRQNHVFPVIATDKRHGVQTAGFNPANHGVLKISELLLNLACKIQV